MQRVKRKYASSMTKSWFLEEWNIYFAKEVVNPLPREEREAEEDAVEREVPETPLTWCCCFGPKRFCSIIVKQ